MSRSACASQSSSAATAAASTSSQNLSGSTRASRPTVRPYHIGEATAPAKAIRWGGLRAPTQSEGSETPPEVVLGRVAQRDQHERAAVARAQAIAQRLRDGPAAAALVARQWEAHGHGPTWRELGHQLGWPYRQVGPSVRALAAAGWLTPGSAPGSLRPGPRFALDQAPGPAALTGR